MSISLNEHHDILRFNTAGSVDNGKSTLIGRLLYDTGVIKADVVEEIAARGLGAAHSGNINLAAFTDGLRAEREQGITIDASYRYFSRGKRDFIVADTPGHAEFTRNMLTATSHSDLALILVDATQGIVGQNRRHAYIASLAGVPRLLVLINKMDLVDFSSERFQQLSFEFNEILSKLPGISTIYIPISALHGDNVVNRSLRIPWYNGPSIMEYLQTVDLSENQAIQDLRFIVQWVESNESTKIAESEVAGKLLNGRLKIQDSVLSVLSGEELTVSRLATTKGQVESIHAPSVLRIFFEQGATIKRGDILSSPNAIPKLAQQVQAEICWMMDTPFKGGSEYILQQASRSTPVIVKSIQSLVDIGSYELKEGGNKLSINEIARVNIESRHKIIVDTFNRNNALGKFILIDPKSKQTAAAGIILN